MTLISSASLKFALGLDDGENTPRRKQTREGERKKEGYKPGPAPANPPPSGVVIAVPCPKCRKFTTLAPEAKALPGET